MKKYKCITAIICSLILLGGASCKKSFLEIVPKGNVIAVTYSDYNDLMNGSNFYVIGKGSSGVWEAFELMGDEIAAENYAYNLNGSWYPEAHSLFQWQDDVFPLAPPPNVYVSVNNPQFMTTLQQNIYTLNAIINGVGGATEATTGQIQELKAEALAERAFTNFQLVNYFTKPYNTATASSDPGFPIVTIADVQGETFTRGTVQQSYDAMIGDLTQAIPNLATDPSIRTRMSKAGAEGLLGKIYLSMGKYSDALTQFKSAFSDMALMSNTPTLYDYNQTFAPGGAFTTNDPLLGPSTPFLSTTDLTESLWGAMTYAGANNGNAYPTNFITITQPTISLFDPSDWRLQFYTNEQTPPKVTPVIPGGRLHRNNLVYARIGIELPDLYLMKAETEARTNDLTDAVADVQTLRNNRMPAAVAPVPADVTTDQTALIKFIIDERTREFASSGARWLDMRRLSNDPIFSGQPAPVHTLYTDATNGTSYTLKPARLTLRIPPYYLSLNPGMTDNP